MQHVNAIIILTAAAIMRRKDMASVTATFAKILFTGMQLYLKRTQTFALVVQHMKVTWREVRILFVTRRLANVLARSIHSDVNATRVHLAMAS